jgi:hypothetical protein
MKKLFFIALLFVVARTYSQNFGVTDSVMKKYTGMLCNCMTTQGIKNAGNKNSNKIMEDCFENVTELYTLSDEAESIKTIFKEKKNLDKFNEETITILLNECEDLKIYFAKEREKKSVPEPNATISESYFLDKNKMKARKMQLKTDSKSMKVWNALGLQKNPKIQIVYDIRYVFKNEKDAQLYYDANLNMLSEDGPEIKNTIEKLGVSQSNVYGNNSATMFGDLDIKMVNYIFRIKNVVAKVFISASKKATDVEMLVFAKEAIARIKAVK